MDSRTSTAITPNSQLPSLTSFRGIAALWVVLYHYSAVYFSKFDFASYTHLIDKGYLAVDMFFMLSGFVLTHVYNRAFSESITRHYRSFLLSRVARLYPLHILILLLFVATAFTSQLREYAATGTFHEIPLEGPRSLIALVANLFMLQGLAAGRLSWNYPAWSISVEFVAYLVFPLILPTIWRTSPLIKLALTVWLTGILAWLAYITQDNFNQWDGPITLLRGLPEFVLGTLLYFAFRDDKFAPLLDSDAVAIIVVGITILALHIGAPDILIVLLFAILILVAAINTRTFAAVANVGPLIWLGNISYSLYLLHGFVQYFVSKLLGTSGVKEAADLSIGHSMVLLMLMIAVCLVSATGTYYGIEIVCRRNLRDLFGLAGRTRARLSLPARPAVRLKSPRV